jgi:hypothetical protein
MIRALRRWHLRECIKDIEAEITRERIRHARFAEIIRNWNLEQRELEAKLRALDRLPDPRANMRLAGIIKGRT